MKLGRITGRVVSEKKLDCFEGIKLLLIQPLDEHLNEYGDVLIGMDTVQAGEGDIVFYEQSKEAGQAMRDWFHPGDTAIIGIVDAIDGVEEEGAAR